MSSTVSTSVRRSTPVRAALPAISRPVQKPVRPTTSAASTFEPAPRTASRAPAAVLRELNGGPDAGAPLKSLTQVSAAMRLQTTPPDPIGGWVDHAFQVLLHRAPTADERAKSVDWINKELGAGKNVFQAAAEVVFFIKIGDEYKKLHPLAGFIGDVYRNELGRDPSDDEVNAAEDRLRAFGAQGKGFLECCAALADEVRTGPEGAAFETAHPFAKWVVSFFQEALGRSPTLDERQKTEELIGKVIANGGNVFTAGAFCDALMRTSPEFKQHHPFADWLEGEYQNTLGRRPSLDEINRCEAAITKYMGEGHNVFEAGALIDFLIKIGPEYQAAHPAAQGPITDRNALYLKQPTGWSCAPTSLTMAEKAWGVGTGDVANVFRTAAGMNDREGVGLPGNASLVAAQAQRDGLQATYNTSREAEAVRAALEAGHTCVVNGSLGVTGGHFIYIAGLDGNGNFIVCDPWRPWITTWSDGDLNYFTHVGQQNPPGFAEIWK